MFFKFQSTLAVNWWSVLLFIVLDGIKTSRFLSMKMALFVDKNGKTTALSAKRGIFVDGSLGYLLYLYDLDFSIRFARSLSTMSLKRMRKK